MSPRPAGISAAATHRLMARGIAAFALLLLIQASGSLLAQTPFMAWWWNAVFLFGFLAVFALAFILAMCGRETTALVATAAALVLLGYATWPLAAPAPLPEGSGPPWSWAMINVGAAWCAYAAGTRIAGAYTVLLGVLFALVRASPTGGGADFSTALQDALLATVMGLVIVMAIGILRQAAARSDAAAQHAVDEYRAAAHQGALRSERARFDALLHDSVMTVLLAASGLQAPGSRARNAKLARSAIERLEDGGRTAPGSRAVAPAELEARIRFANDTGHGTMALDVAPAAGDGTGIPAEVARALFEACTEAVTNARRHAAAARCQVSLECRGHGERARVRLLVIDDGKGFDPDAVPARRLGIKVSITGRMDSVGGHGRIESRPGRGTAVQLLWEASSGEGERA
ncbi:sensor histidine kinase [Paeniglutamicibacter psychrophenolicus]|uniref:sensor histidine kinase n=1 Tax=Paeniglutamicibacter psychrophenolicus TaxID=257454 RepID=UPI00278B0602|nr:ATP-binding protein [Paeniglutamicibacter psychrophenolicus]MDQ0093680.1 signal transduction histidine kinase [Paeniglutamicibacter psychrophenolicus]